MENCYNHLDIAHDLGIRELECLESQDIQQAEALAQERGKLMNSVFNSATMDNRDEFLEKLKKLQRMQTRITESARNLHEVLSQELKRVKTENIRFTGYKKASTVTPIFNPYLNKKG
ncbi:MAG: hypothetical protein ACOCPN_02385 [Desulfonatronovibrionaceae bacterium]